MRVRRSLPAARVISIWKSLLASIQRRSLRRSPILRPRLIAELELFRYKVDPRWDGDPMGPEGNSWVRATEMIAGGERVFPSQRE